MSKVRGDRSKTKRGLLQKVCRIYVEGGGMINKIEFKGYSNKCLDVSGDVFTEDSKINEQMRKANEIK